MTTEEERNRKRKYRAANPDRVRQRTPEANRRHQERYQEKKWAEFVKQTVNSVYQHYLTTHEDFL